MGKISRRNFLRDSLIFAGSSFLLSSKYLEASTRAALEVKKIRKYPSYLELEEKGILSQRIEKLYSIYENCYLCPRNCRVDRTKGETGKCKATSKVKVSSAFPHFGEERPLVGKRGSGTIFFSNCGLRCVYCQNYEISIEGEGVEISDERLAAMMMTLQRMGCHNINLVTPSHYVPNIVCALQKAIRKGLHIPLVYNCAPYETPETLQLLDGIIDIYLPDCKFMDPEHAAKYSGQTYNYPYYAKIALKEMQRQVGILQVGGRGIAVRGLMIRHLILPNNIAGTDKFIKFVAENFPKNTYLNLMAQYRPEYKAFDYPELSRRLKRSEYREALGLARKYGLSRLAS